MADIIAPRRGESIVDENGMPTTRFHEYLERSTTQVNETIPDTEIDTPTIDVSVAPIAALSKRVRELELQSGIDLVNSGLADQVVALELLASVPNSAAIADMQRQIDELKILVT